MLGKKLTKKENALLMRLYIRQAALAQEMRKNEFLIKPLIEKRWGFHYSQVDSHLIIDTLDYGTSQCTYTEFVQLMNEYREEIEDGLRKVNV